MSEESDQSVNTGLHLEEFRAKMIKIGCAAYSYREYFKDGRMNYASFIEEAHKIRLDGVELTLYWPTSKDPKYLKELKMLALSRGLPISCVGISTNFCDATPSGRERAVSSVREGLTVAQELGAPVLRIFGGYPPQRMSVEEATNLAIEMMRTCVCQAEKVGVILALENHGGITAKADDVIRIINNVDSPWLRVNLDLGNYSQSIYEEIERTVPYTVHVHAKVRVPGGPELDYKRIKELLDRELYNGFISIEYEEQEDPIIGVPKFAKHLMNLFM